MRLLRYLSSRTALLDELETLRRENAALREELLVERLFWSWVRRKPSPEALLLPEKPASMRSHPVQVGRHHRADPTEIAPRRQR